ncbi:MAG TPA: hypothetical protein VK190_02880 [Pseudoneobacillus sp.]|nr:hypothetical protein [Pseudoneobacillus sp.]
MYTDPSLTKGVVANTLYKDDNGNEFYAYADNEVVITCWKLTFWEKIKVIFTGKLWVLIVGPQVPMKITVYREDIFEE